MSPRAGSSCPTASPPPTPTPSPRTAGPGWSSRGWPRSCTGSSSWPGGRTGCRSCTACCAWRCGALGWVLSAPGAPARRADPRHRRAPGRGHGVLVAAPAAHGAGAVRPAHRHGRERHRARRGRRCRSCGCGCNVHGSWPFALAYLVLRLAGRRADGAPWAGSRGSSASRWPARLLGALNPIGLRLVGVPPHRAHPSPGLLPHRRVAVAQLLRRRERGVPGQALLA